MHSQHIYNVALHLRGTCDIVLLSDLVHIVETNDPIESAVQVVEEIHHLHRPTLRAKRRKTNNVAKVNRDALKLLRLHHFAGEQLCCHRPVYGM